MENSWEKWQLDLKRALEDGEDTVFQEIMERRNVYIAAIENPNEKKEALSYFLEKDKELVPMIEERKRQIKQLLLTQNGQMKAVKKYENF